jgi:hypothetical protein
MSVALLASAGRRLGDLALVCGFGGGLVVAWGARGFLSGSQDEGGRRRERILTLIGAMLIAGAFFALLVVQVFLH